MLGSAQAGRRSSLKLLAAAGRRGPDRVRPGGGDGPRRGRPAAHERIPALKEAIDDFLGDRRAEFLDKA